MAGLILRGFSHDSLIIAVMLCGAPPLVAQTGSGRAPASGVSDAYPAIERFFAQNAAPLTHLSVTTRRPLGRGDTLLLVRAAMPDRLRRRLTESGYPGNALLSAYAAFVVRKGTVPLALGLEEAVRGDAQLSWGADDMRIEAASARAVTLALYSDAYGALDRKITYLIDHATRTVLRRIVHRGLVVGALIPFRDSIYAAVSPDGKTSTLVVIPRRTPRIAEGAVASRCIISTLDEVGGARLPVVQSALASGDSVTLYGDSVALVRTARGWSRRVLPISTREVVPERVSFPPVPVPTYARFARLRPQRARDGYTAEGTHLEAAIGAFQVVRDTVWFGTRFYDGEGTTGVGAIGSLALSTGRYDLRYLPILADWSTSAIAADGDVLWLGLVTNPEGATQSGGVLRYNRRTGAAHRYALPQVVHVLVPWDGTIYAGTSDGVYRLEHGRFVPVPLGFDPRGSVVTLGSSELCPR